ncbi:hypothetical protein JMM81_03130 [Bacillus sp. V3B]|uniref:hypothetical protein n=1 Tax=Bacillus sp. V3B TaxID=2804915 RepID=UPI00210ED134|nr:hypothetical protein [Bacillus sp. V3B]MCQ6273971.1 hypothetical protein [Bacillus sp. V3B]
MFDPTAYENMRVVLEGIFYDKDLSGEIMIVDRNDIINTAKLSRIYDLSFQLSTSPSSRVICRMKLKADIENLTAELLSSAFSNKVAGCMVTIEFLFEHNDDESFLIEIERVLKQIWGEERTIKLMVCREPLISLQKAKYTAHISFGRIIREDQVDDLTEMTEYMMKTLHKLEHIL